MIFYKIRSSSSTDYRSLITDHRSFADYFSLKSTLILLLITLTLIITYPIPTHAKTKDADIRVSVKPEGEVRVGQRVTLNIDLMSTTWFSGIPVFDLPEIPGAFVLKVGSFAVNSSETINGETFSIQRHEFALFFQKPGDIVVPPFNVRFYSAAPGGGKPNEINDKTPELNIQASMPPGAEKLSTIICTNNFEVSEKWEPKPEEAMVGDAFTRIITMRADGVLGMAFTPLNQMDVKGVGVYSKDPIVSDKMDRGNFIGERTETRTYVCEQAGTVTIPEVVIHWWDMEREELKTKTLPSVKLIIKPNPQLIQEAGSTTIVLANQRLIKWLAAIIILFTVCAGIFFRFRKALARSVKAWMATRKNSEKAYFNHFKTACRSGHPNQIYATLLGWLDIIHTGNHCATIVWLTAASESPALTEQVSNLESELFKKSKPNTHSWDSRLFFKEVSKARRHLIKKRIIRNKSNRLAELNPSGLVIGLYNL